VRYLLFSVLASFLLGGVVVSTRTQAKQSTEPQKSESQETEQQEKDPKEYEDEMEDFTPSEKVPADSAISFPVDI
jgi:hypothetical protein